MENYAGYGKYNIESILESITIDFHKNHYRKYQLDRNEEELTLAEMLQGFFFSASIYKIPQYSTNILIRAPPSFLYFTKEILEYMEDKS